AITTFAILFNTFLAKKLPLVEALILVIHVVGLFAIVIPLWVLAPRSSAKAVFTEFNNGGGWNSAGTAFMIGLATTISSMVGYDCAVHMCKRRLNIWGFLNLMLTKMDHQLKRLRTPPKRYQQLS